MYVTLKSLRQEGACFEGYNKVVRHLQGKPFTPEDEERESYIRYAHKDSISLISIVESNGIDDALWALRCVPNVDRDARLFAVWCARQVQHLITDKRIFEALDVAEKFANGEASENELTSAWGAARDAARAAAWDAARGAARGAARDAAMDAARDAAWDAARDAARGAARGAAWGAAWDAARDAARGAARGAAWDAARGAARGAAWGAAWDAAWGAQKEMFIKMCKGEAPWQK